MATQTATQTQTQHSASPSMSSSATIIGNHFKVGKKLGEGSFGVVFDGTNMLNGQQVAIKFEPRKSEAPQLRDEWRAYRQLHGCLGIPQVYHFGQEGLHNVLVMDLLGPNLEDLFDMCGRRFTIKTVCLLAKQMITRVQTIHNKSLIYRDIKPDNFLIGAPGTPTANHIHMVDFGMAKHYRDPKTRVHIPYRERKSLSGTARYMSINTHLGREQSRRDDLEGLGHVFMYFLRGSLPWQGLKAATNKQKYEKIGEKKQTTPISELCDGFPAFSIYLNYVRKLGFEESPDYDFLKDLFVKTLAEIGEVDDGVFDWMLLNGGKGWEASAPPHGQSAANREREREQRERRRRERDRERERGRTASAAVGISARGSPTPNHPHIASTTAAVVGVPLPGSSPTPPPIAAAGLANGTGHKRRMSGNPVFTQLQQQYQTPATVNPNQSMGPGHPYGTAVSNAFMYATTNSAPRVVGTGTPGQDVTPAGSMVAMGGGTPLPPNTPMGLMNGAGGMNGSGEFDRQQHLRMRSAGLATSAGVAVRGDSGYHGGYEARKRGWRSFFVLWLSGNSLLIGCTTIR